MEHINQVIDVLSPEKNSINATAMSQYMRGKFEFLGIKSPLRKKLTGQMITDIARSPIEEIIESLDVLWALPEREYQMVGLDLMVKSKKKFRSQDLPKLEYWLITKSWWDTVDLMASHNVGYLFYQDERIKKKTTTRWLQSPNIWLNRCCLIYQLKYKDDTNLEILFDHIDQLKHKDEFFIQKAIGWALRQASKFYPYEVENFIATHNLSNLAKKEGSKYL